MLDLCDSLKWFFVAISFKSGACHWSHFTIQHVTVIRFCNNVQKKFFFALNTWSLNAANYTSETA